MKIHDDYWWTTQEALLEAAWFVWLSKQVLSCLREGIVVTLSHEMCAKYSRLLNDTMQKLSFEDKRVIRDLIAEAMR